MIRNFCKRGSILLCALLMLGGVILVLQLGLLGAISWQDVANQRCIYAQHYRMAQIILHEGIAYIVENKENFGTETCKKFDQFPLDSLRGYTGFLTIKKSEKARNLEAVLSYSSKPVLTLTCSLMKDEPIEGWILSDYVVKT